MNYTQILAIGVAYAVSVPNVPSGLAPWQPVAGKRRTWPLNRIRKARSGRSACALRGSRFTANAIQGVTAATTVGTNGDGAIDGIINAQGLAESGSEAAEAPWQLYNAGFIGKIDAGSAQKRLSTSFGAVHLVSNKMATGLVAGFAAANPAARNAIVFQNLACDVALEADTKMDDGSLTSGKGIGTNCVNGLVAWYAIVL